MFYYPGIGLYITIFIVFGRAMSDSWIEFTDMGVAICFKRNEKTDLASLYTRLYECMIAVRHKLQCEKYAQHSTELGGSIFTPCGRIGLFNSNTELTERGLLFKKQWTTRLTWDIDVPTNYHVNFTFWHVYLHNSPTPCRRIPLPVEGLHIESVRLNKIPSVSVCTILEPKLVYWPDSKPRIFFHSKWGIYDSGQFYITYQVCDAFRFQNTITHVTKNRFKPLGSTIRTDVYELYYFKFGVLGKHFLIAVSVGCHINLFVKKNHFLQQNNNVSEYVLKFYDGPGSRGYQLRVPATDASFIVNASTFQVYVIMLCSTSECRDAIIEYRSEFVKEKQYLSIKDDKSLKMSVPSSDFPHCNLRSFGLYCAFHLVTSFPNYINVSTVNMNLNGTQDGNCRYGGVAMYDSKRDEMLSKARTWNGTSLADLLVAVSLSTTLMNLTYTDIYKMIDYSFPVVTFCDSSIVADNYNKLKKKPILSSFVSSTTNITIVYFSYTGYTDFSLFNISLLIENTYCQGSVVFCRSDILLPDKVILFEEDFHNIRDLFDMYRSIKPCKRYVYSTDVRTYAIIRQGSIICYSYNDLETNITVIRIEYSKCIHVQYTPDPDYNTAAGMIERAVCNIEMRNIFPYSDHSTTLFFDISRSVSHHCLYSFFLSKLKIYGAIRATSARDRGGRIYFIRLENVREKFIEHISMGQFVNFPWKCASFSNSLGTFCKYYQRNGSQYNHIHYTRKTYRCTVFNIRDIQSGIYFISFRSLYALTYAKLKRELRYFNFNDFVFYSHSGAHLVTNLVLSPSCLSNCINMTFVVTLQSLEDRTESIYWLIKKAKYQTFLVTRWSLLSWRIGIHTKDFNRSCFIDARLVEPCSAQVNTHHTTHFRNVFHPPIIFYKGSERPRDVFLMLWKDSRLDQHSVAGVCESLGMKIIWFSNEEDRNIIKSILLGWYPGRTTSSIFMTPCRVSAHRCLVYTDLRISQVRYEGHG